MDASNNIPNGGGFDENPAITTISELELILNNFFTMDLSWPEMQNLMFDTMKRINLSAEETRKYIVWDPEKAYTRNLIAMDPTRHHYAILILCWNAGRETKIHNHPCDGCFIRTLSGAIREERYEIDPVTAKVILASSKIFDEGQVSYMDDYLGYHKIDNPSSDRGAVTLHIYTPPYTECKTWGTNNISRGCTDILRLLVGNDNGLRKFPMIILPFLLYPIFTFLTFAYSESYFILSHNGPNLKKESLIFLEHPFIYIATWITSTGNSADSN
eukprot:gene6495-13107_t